MNVPLRLGMDPSDIVDLRANVSKWTYTNENKRKRILVEETRIQKEFLEVYNYFVSIDADIPYSHGYLVPWWRCKRKIYKHLKLYDTP